MARFYVGEHVKRRWNVYSDTSVYRTGVILEIYSDMISQFGPYPELYKVRWDDGQIEKGFLPHGLEES